MTSFLSSLVGSGSGSTETPVAIGLVNLGNTCFANSVLQALTSLRSFHLFLKANLETEEQRIVLEKVRETVRSLSIHSDSALKPSCMEVKQILNRFGTYEQQDAHEFMSYVLEHISEEIETESPIKPNLSSLLDICSDENNNNNKDLVEQDIFKIDLELESTPRKRKPSYSISLLPLSKNLAPALVWPSPASNSSSSTSNSTLVSPQNSKLSNKYWKRNPFMGRFKSQLHCLNCDQPGHPSYQSFTDISVALPERDRDCSLNECLSNFTTTEHISDATCEKCMAKRKNGANVISGSRKRLTIIKAPNILCLHMRRLVTSRTGANVKLNCHVQFSEEFDLSPFCTTDPRPENLVRGASSSSKYENLMEKAMAMYMGSSSTTTTTTGSISVSPPKPISNGFISTSPPRSSMPGGSTASSPRQNSFNSPGVHNQHNNRTNVANSNAPARKAINSFGTSPTGSRSSSLSVQSSPFLYRLVSVIVHHGNHSGGHYTTFRRILNRPLKDEESYEQFVNDLKAQHPFDDQRKSAEWVHISDQNVRRSNLQEVLESQAYILYYERINND